MAIIKYEVSGGWHAEDDGQFMACFGFTIEEAEANLCDARERARLIEYRHALAPETDIGLGDEELAAIAEARRDLANGRYEIVKPNCRQGGA